MGKTVSKKSANNKTRLIGISTSRFYKSICFLIEETSSSPQVNKLPFLPGQGISSVFPHAPCISCFGCQHPSQVKREVDKVQGCMNSIWVSRGHLEGQALCQLWKLIRDNSPLAAQPYNRGTLGLSPVSC